MDRHSSTSFYDSVTAWDSALPAAPALPMYLILVSGGMTGAMFRLAPGASRLGRAPDNVFLLYERSISRSHALFDVDPDGEAWLSDLGSTNGTFVDGETVREIELHDGDTLRVGTTALVYRRGED